LPHDITFNTPILNKILLAFKYTIAVNRLSTQRFFSKRMLYTTALDANALETPQLLGKKAAKLAQQKLGARSLASQKCPVIFTPRVSPQ
jgi:predicted Zn-dependent protease